MTFGLVSAVERAFRGPGGRRIAGSVEHTAPLAPGLVGRRPRRRRRAARRPQHEPDRRGVLPRPAGRCRAPRAGRRARSRRVAGAAAARRGHRPEPRRASAAPLGRPARARRRPRPRHRGGQRSPTRPGIEAGDLIVSAGGAPIRDADDLHDALAALELPFELGIVRGAEERTVAVTSAEAGAHAGRRLTPRSHQRDVWDPRSVAGVPGPLASARDRAPHRLVPHRLVGRGASSP